MNRRNKKKLYNKRISRYGYSGYLSKFLTRNVVDQNMKSLREFFNGKWVQSEKVQEMFNMTFKECVSVFDMSRTAEWWSVVGFTDEERQLDGQKITVSFRLKERNDKL